MVASAPGRIFRRFVLVLCFLSGISGLLYEVAWARMLHLLFGDTVLAVSTVLASFMAGLALGSFWIGRFIDRRRRVLAVYASQPGSPRSRARLASGRWPAFAGREWVPAGPLREVSGYVIALLLSQVSWRN